MYFFIDFLIPHHEIYDIGTKILYFQCFFTTDMFLFCKTILYSGSCRIFRDLAFGSIKTRFKAILKKLDFSAQIDFSAHIYFFHDFSPRRATFLPNFTFLMNCCLQRATFLPTFIFLMNFCPRRATFLPKIDFVNELLPPEGD